MCALSIGQLSQATRTPVATIRYYESIGLFGQVGRSQGNQRQFSQADQETLHFIRSRRQLGFSIARVKELLAVAGPGQTACGAARETVLAQLQYVQAQIDSLTWAKADLLRQMDNCNADCVDERAISCTLVPGLAQEVRPGARPRAATYRQPQGVDRSRS